MTEKLAELFDEEAAVEFATPRPPEAARVRGSTAQRRMAVALLGGALVLLAAIPAAPQAPRSAQRVPEPPLKIEIRARPIAGFDARDASRRQFGELLFRGGLELTSPYKEFGGLSGIRLSADGAQFIAVSDKGRWFRGRILYRNGRPEGIADAEMAPVLGPDGRPITARGWYDTEAIAQDGGTLYVAPRARPPDSALRLRQGWLARPRPADRGAAGLQAASQQQGASNAWPSSPRGWPAPAR